MNKFWARTVPLGPDHPVLGLHILVKATVAWTRPSVVWRQDSLTLPDLRDPEHPPGSQDKQPVLSWSLPHAVCKLHPCGKHIPETGISVADAKHIFRNALALSQAGSDFSERNMVLTFLVAQLLQAGFPLLHDGVRWEDAGLMRASSASSSSGCSQAGGSLRCGQVAR